MSLSLIIDECLKVCYTLRVMDYELTLILDPDLTTDAQKKLIAKIKKLIEDPPTRQPAGEKGKVEKTDDLGKKDFAYPITKKTFGYYYLLIFSVSKEAIIIIDKKIKLEEGVLRYLLIKREGPAFAKATAGKEGSHGTKIAK